MRQVRESGSNCPPEQPFLTEDRNRIPELLSRFSIGGLWGSVLVKLSMEAGATCTYIACKAAHILQETHTVFTEALCYKLTKLDFFLKK